MNRHAAFVLAATSLAAIVNRILGIDLISDPYHTIMALVSCVGFCAALFYVEPRK